MVDNMYTGGVMPVGQVEPFNPYQIQGLTQLGTMQYARPNALGYNQGAAAAFQKAGAGMPNPMAAFGDATKFYNQAQTDLNAYRPLVNRATQGLDDATFQASVSRFINPYQQEVVSRTINALNEQGEQARARLMGKQAGRSSFGDTSQAIQLSELAKNLMQTTGDTAARLNYQGYSDAANNALAQFNTERARELQGAGAFQSGAQIAGGLGGQRAQEGLGQIRSLQDLARIGFEGNRANWFNTQQENELRDREIQNRLMAGGAIQAQNQRLADIISGEVKGSRDYDTNLLAMISQLIAPFASGTDITKGSNNTLNSIYGGAVAGGQVETAIDDFFKNRAVSSELDRVISANAGGIF